ncbi:MAG TPA: sigma-70 family RNA polymerase sigma factor [Actinocrinis sp.]|jgi:RNA polymerase sigma factor (sigma-70 family)|uniref:sigma-70 family RNA polymerase sigma factor n=1 Tax=Actinocrinis sp. TaxID=1920516 RepID=UPI002DDD3AD4|nr:sigma-70 family RNA polymerase sigma factor [Actinocrinis sp.]HEV3173337.1 sigma-70 family RNA polymerase sigma factor [Actinocrinis sp.]
MPDASVVQAARAGDARALDALVGAYLPLVYNIVGRALDAPADVDDVVQDVMLEMVRDLRQLRDPDAFRSWLVAIAMRRVRGHWRQRRAEPGRAALEEAASADPGADFVDLTIAALGLSDQRREVAQATRWLDEEDRHLLALWWLEAAGELTRAELAAAMDSTPSQVAVLVHRTKARLETARTVVRALQAVPICPELAEVCLGWDGRPSGLWRKRIARHVRECPSCSALHLDLVPAESLLVGLALVPVPFALLSVPYVPPTAGARSESHAEPGHGAGHGRALARGRGIRHWTALPTAGKAAVAGVAALSVIAGVTGVRYAADHRTTAAVAPRPHAPTTAAAPLNTASPSPSSTAPTASPSASASPSPSQAAAGIVNTAFPIRAAFYYPWYPENFQPPGSHYMPSAGHYSVDESATVDRQIEDMQYAGLQAGIESWWGQGTREDKRLPLLMTEAAKLGFSWSAYYEQEAYGDPSPAQIASDLIYLRKYSEQKAWLHVDGLPVIFVYASGTDGCGMATRWAQANQTAHYYVVLKVFGGYRGCADQPQGWHQYADALDVQPGYSAIVSPGFWKNDEQTPQVPRDLTRFRKDATTVATSGAPFQLVVTYNEWGEGTAVESATDWSSPDGHGAYIDILHQVFAAYPR